MAQKRMFSKHITNDERFLEMPLSSQALYLHLNMNADDDGFVQPKRILRMVGAKEDDLRVLLAKGFILELPNTENVIVITHWKVNNTLRKDRYTISHYSEHLKMLGISENMTYLPEWQPNGNQMATQDSIGKDRVGKGSKENMTRPTIEEVKAYILEKSYKVDAEVWYHHYESNGWKVGKNSMKSWKSSLAYWEKNDFNKNVSRETNQKESRMVGGKVGEHAF